MQAASCWLPHQCWYSFVAWSWLLWLLVSLAFLIRIYRLFHSWHSLLTVSYRFWLCLSLNSDSWFKRYLSYILVWFKPFYMKWESKNHIEKYISVVRISKISENKLIKRWNVKNFLSSSKKNDDWLNGYWSIILKLFWLNYVIGPQANLSTKKLNPNNCCELLRKSSGILRTTSFKYWWLQILILITFLLNNVLFIFWIVLVRFIMRHLLHISLY